MSTEVIASITEAEEAARQAVAAARQNAKRAVSEAEAEAAAFVAATVSRADDEVKTLLAAAEKKAAENTEEFNNTTANRCAAMRAHAEARLDDAARLIVERIVNG